MVWWYMVFPLLAHSSLVCSFKIPIALSILRLWCFFLSVLRALPSLGRSIQRRISREQSRLHTSELNSIPVSWSHEQVVPSIDLTILHFELSPLLNFPRAFCLREVHSLYNLTYSVYLSTGVNTRSSLPLHP